MYTNVETRTICGPVSPARSSFRPLSVNRYFSSKNEFQWETTPSKHSSMSLLSLSRVAAFKLSSKAVNFLSENDSVYCASNYIVPFETSFYLFAWIKRVNFLSRERRKN